jgi:UPF0271 protein
MGESYGIYQLGDDPSIMPYITHANVACGFHASDPNHIQKTVALAKRYNVNVGAHFSLPDRQGFGRREMECTREELLNLIIYQIGALNGFLVQAGMKLSHLKPHGALYAMAAKYEHVAMAIADAATVFGLPVFGMSGTLQEDIYRSQNIPFIAEFFADLDYDETGHLIITQSRAAPRVVEDVIEKVNDVIQQRKVRTIKGAYIHARSETICVHSDTPNAVELVKAISAYVQKHAAEDVC